MPRVSRGHFLPVIDKNKAVNSETNEVQIEEGKSMVHTPFCFAMFSEKAGMDVQEADAAL